MVRRALVVLTIAVVAFGCDAPLEVAPAPEDAMHARVGAPPPAPSNLTATAVTANRIDLAWSYRGAAGPEIRIERSTASDDAFVHVATTGSDVRTFSDTGLSGATMYWYRVQACTAAGCSAYSNVASATTPSDGPWAVEPVPHILRAVTGVSATNVMAVGSGVALKYDGTGWSNITQADPLWHFPPSFWDTWAASEEAMYGLQLCDQIAKHDGSQWSLVGPHWQQSAAPEEDRPLCWFYWSIWGSSSDDIFLVGEFGQAAHFDGVHWTVISPGPFNVFTDELLGVWGSSSTNVFVVGGDHWGSGTATILHYDGAVWTTLMSSADTETPLLLAVWGSGPDDVFAVGREGTILRLSGGEWSPMDSGTMVTLSSVWGTSSTNVYAVGTGGTILHFDGASWSGVDVGTAANLTGVWVAPSGEVFAVGNGVLVRGTPESTADQSDGPSL